MAADGSITIDTRVDTGGMKAGIKAVSNSFSGLQGAVKKTTQSLAQAFLGGKNFATIFKSIAKFSAAALIGGSLISSIRNLAGSFDLASSSIGDKVKPLSAALETLKGTFVNLILTAFVPMIPHLIAFATWLTKILITVSQVVAALFGFKQTVGSVMTSAAANAKKAAKEAKGALASFDAINVLQIQKPEEGEGGTTTPAPLTVPQELLDKVAKLKAVVMEFLKPAIELFEKLKKIVVDIFEKIVAWAKENPKAFGIILLVIGLVILAFIALVAILWVVSVVMGVVTAVTAAFAAVMAFIASPIFLIVVIIGLLIAILVILALNWDTIKLLAVATWEKIKEVWGIAVAWFKTNVVEPLKETFTKALDWIKDKFTTIFTTIKDFVRGVIDGIIGYIASLVQSILAGIAAVSGGINSIGGGSIGGAMATASMRIPRLATGGIIPPNAQFAAILGDQRSGYNIEAPAAMFQEMLNKAVASGQGGEMTITMPVYLDGEKIYQNQKRVNTRHGRSLINGRGS